MKKGTKWQQHSWTIVRLVSYLSSHWYKGGGAEAKSMICQLNLICMVGVQSLLLVISLWISIILSNSTVFFTRSTILQRLKCHWKSAYISWLTHYLNKMMIWEREALELHQVLEILLQPLLVMTGRNIWLDADWEPFSSQTAGAVHASTPRSSSSSDVISRGIKVSCAFKKF